MELKTIKFEVEKNIGILKINRPDKLNALNSQVFNELDYLLSEIESYEAKVLIITGEGDNFAAGADIKEMQGLSKEEAKKFSEKGQKVFNKIENLEIPVIAVVKGYALGGGCELAMSCDFIYASDEATFGQPEVNLGLIPGYAATRRLVQKVGMPNALELMMTAEMIDSQTALDLKLVNKVFSANEVMESAMKTAGKINKKGPNAVKSIKSVVRKSYGKGIEEAEGIESEHFSSLFDTDAVEGIEAFLSKRKPKWD